MKLEKLKNICNNINVVYNNQPILPQTQVIKIKQNSDIEYFDSVIHYTYKSDIILNQDIIISFDNINILLNKLPNEEYNINIENNNLVIYNDKLNYKLPNVEIENYIEPPIINNEQLLNSITHIDITTIVEQNSNALSLDPQEQDLNNFICYDNICYSTNKILASKTPISINNDIILNNKILKALDKLLDTTFNIYYNEEYIIYKNDSIQFISKLISKNDNHNSLVKNLFDISSYTYCEVDRNNLYNIIDRLSLFDKDSENVYFNFNNNILTITSSNEINKEVISYASQTPFQYDKILINSKNLLKQLDTLIQGNIKLYNKPDMLIIEQNNIMKLVALSE